MNVQCICPIGIGNYLMCYPAFNLLKKKRPDLSMYLIALRRSIGELAQDDPLWSGVDTFDPDKIKIDVVRMSSILAGLRRRHCDVSLCFFPSNSWQYFSLPLLSGISRRYAFRYEKKRLSSLSFLCTDSVPVDPSLHDIDQNVGLVQAFLHETMDREHMVFPRLFGDEEKAWAMTYYAHRSQNQVRIAVHPGSSVEHGMRVKRWAPERFGRLVDLACRLLSAEAYVFGSSDESDVKNAVAVSMKETVHVVDPVSIRKTAALLSECAVCIANDSGIMHMAACSGVPTVGIFGPTDERRNGPWGGKSLVIRKSVHGFPLWTARNVGDRALPKGVDPGAALDALTTEDAWRQLEQWLGKTLLSPSTHS